jgi:hypothetical protein
MAKSNIKKNIVVSPLLAIVNALDKTTWVLEISGKFKIITTI